MRTTGRGTAACARVVATLGDEPASDSESDTELRRSDAERTPTLGELLLLPQEANFDPAGVRRSVAGVDSVAALFS